MIRIPDRIFVKKLMIWLIVIAFLVAAANIAYLSYESRKNYNKKIAMANQFLTHVQYGEVSEAGLLWPEVYTSMKENPEFLESFSDVLFIVYNDYYNNTYINGRESDNLFEEARLYHSFLDDNKFDETASIILDDYINEKITYESFIAAENDLFLFSGYSSAHIPIVIDKGILLNDSRSFYNQAEEAAKLKDYSKAIDLMKLVSPFDTVYYPKSILKIDEYIKLLTELVKNGS